MNEREMKAASADHRMAKVYAERIFCDSHSRRNPEIRDGGTIVGWSIVEPSSAKIGPAKKEKANHVSMTGLY